MGFQDRLYDDVNRIFLGSKTFEEDLTFAYKSSGTQIAIVGTVDIDSFNTAAGVEATFNRSIASVCTIYVSTIFFTTDPSMYDTITQGTTEWSIKQFKKEGGMYQFMCTANETRSRARLR